MRISPLDSIAISWYGASCRCRCRHCLLENTGERTSLAYSSAKAVVEKFIDWSRKSETVSVPIFFTVGYSCDFPELIDYVRFGKQLGMYCAQFLPINGIAFRTPSELESLLGSLRDAGVNKVGLTFFGTGRSHDTWAGRKGDFEYLLQIAETAAKCGLEREETLFLTRDGIGSLSELVSVMDTVPGLAGRSISHWEYRGAGKRLERERLTEGCIRRLPEELKQYISLETYRPESHWIRWLREGNLPQRKRRNYLIPLSEQTIDWIERSDCGQVIEEMQLESDRFTEAIPPLSQLAESFGHKRGCGLYMLRDLEWKWIDSFLDEHPEIEQSARFSDLAPCVMVK